MGFMRPMIVHDYIDNFISRQGGIVPYRFEELACCYLICWTTELVNKVTVDTVADTAKNSYARESCTRNCNVYIVAFGHVRRFWSGPGVHWSLVHVTEGNFCHNQSW